MESVNKICGLIWREIMGMMCNWPESIYVDIFTKFVNIKKAINCTWHRQMRMI